MIVHDVDGDVGVPVGDHLHGPIVLGPLDHFWVSFCLSRQQVLGFLKPPALVFVDHSRHVDCGEPAVQRLLPRVWVEATLGEVDVDVDGAVLLDTLWNVELSKVLVAAVGVLATSPVAVYEVLLLPEKRRRGVEVCKVLVLGDVHVQVH